MIRSFYLEFLKQSGSGRRSRFPLRAGISVVVLALLFWWFSTDVLLSALMRIPLSTWCLVIGGFIAGHILSAFKWRVLLQAVGVRVTAVDAMRAHGAGLFANLCLPSIIGGDVVRVGMVMRRHHAYEHIALGSLADRINDSLALLLLATVGATLVPTGAESVASEALRGIALVLFTGVLAIIFLIRVVPSSWLPERLSASQARLRTGLNLLIGAPAVALLAFFASIVIQGGFVLLNVILARAMGIEAPAAMWLFAWPLAKLIALAPVSLGGIGVREVAMAGLLALFGIDAAMVVAQSLSWELVLIGSGLLAGVIVAVTPAPIPAEEGTAG